MTITPLIYMLALVISIVILLVLTLKLKMNSFMALFFTAMGLAIFFGASPIDSLNTITGAFGKSLGSIGLPVLFGAILAMGVQDSGAAVAISNFFVKLFKGKHLELAPALTAFVMAISVFGDISQLLTAPIAATIAKRKNMNMAVVTPYVITAVWFTHGVVPPSAAILAVAILLGADVGMVILWGLVICLAALLIIYAVTIRWMTEHASYAAPKPEYTVGIEPVKDGDTSVESLLMKEDDIPNALIAFLPLIVPAGLIAVASICAMVLPEESSVLKVINFIGNKSIAMLVGIIILILTNGKIKTKMLRNANRTEKISENASLLELGMGNWVKRAIDVSAMVLMVTAMGAAFASVLSSQPVVSEIAEVVAKSGIPMILIPFIIAAVMRAAAGSMATASMAAAGICLPIMGMLGLSPVAVTLAIGLGTVLFGHINDSGCWMCQEVFNVDLPQYLKYVSPMAAFGGCVGMALLMILSVIGLV